MISTEDRRKKTISKLDSIGSLGFIPKIMFDVTQLIKSEPGNAIKLAATISKDLGLTTKVLTIANSPLYGLTRKVSSLEFALILMGSEEVGQIVTAVSLADAIKFRSEKFNYMDYWKHSMIVGASAKDIARRVGFQDLSGEAFLAGMLHDVGVQLIAKYFIDEFYEILDLVKSGDVFLNAEKKALGLTHQEIGKYLAQKWKLPDTIAETMEYHHIPSLAPQSAVLSAIVHLADSMTQEFKIGNCYWDNDIYFDVAITEILGFNSAEKMAAFVADYQEIFQEASETIKL
jgi:putative nucleotidyltransferase with HDIG domain